MVDSSTPRLAKGSFIGPHTVLSYLRTEALGQRYTVLYGSVAHLLDLLVPPEDSVLSNEEVADIYKNLVRLSGMVRGYHTVSHYFVCGEDNGLPWIRTDHVKGITERSTETLFKNINPDGSNTQDGEQLATVFNLRELYESIETPLAAADRDHILLDVLEGLAALHSIGAAPVSLQAKDISLNEISRSHRFVALLDGWQMADGEAPVAHNLAEYAFLIREMLEHSAKSRSGKYLLHTALRIEKGELKTAVETLRFVLEQFVSTGIGDSLDRLERLTQPNGLLAFPSGDAATEAANADTNSAGGMVQASDATQEKVAGYRRSSHHHHHHRKSSIWRSSGNGPKRRLRFWAESGSETAIIIIAALRGFVFLVLIAGLAYGVLYWMRWVDRQERRRFRFESGVSYSSVQVIPLSEDIEEGHEEVANTSDEQKATVDLFGMSERQIEVAAAEGNMLAALRLAFTPLLTGKEAVLDQDTAKKLTKQISPFMESLVTMVDDSNAAAFFYGYERLLGLTAPADPGKALFYLRGAAEGHVAWACMLLGDWYASDRKLPPSATQMRSDRDREAIAYYRAAEKAFVALGDEENSGVAQTRVVYLLHLNRIIITERENEYLEYVKGLAQHGNVPAMAFLAVSGGIVPNDSGLQFTWLRALSNFQRLAPPIRGWAQVRMAQRFAAGNGTPRSDNAAFIWYDRAAKAGNETAIRTLISWCKSGRGIAKPDPEAVAKWEAKLTELVPEPDFFPLISLPLSIWKPTMETKKTATGTP
ncbi:MAG: tetratricopeptide repeat protein [Kiritimatiellia bacterium]